MDSRERRHRDKKSTQRRGAATTNLTHKLTGTLAAQTANLAHVREVDYVILTNATAVVLMCGFRERTRASDRSTAWIFGVSADVSFVVGIVPSCGMSIRLYGGEFLATGCLTVA